MPRRPSNMSISPRRDEDAKNSLTIEVDKSSFVKELRDFFADRRTRIVCGAILLAFALFTLIAWISYFFTGLQDQSMLTMSSAERHAARLQFANVVGLPGARLADFLIDGSFGLASLAILAMIILYGLRLLHAIQYSGWRILFVTAFWTFWGSVTLGFIQDITNAETFFRWGGKHGEWLSELMTSYIQPVGSIIVIVLVLFIFLIIVDPAFVPHAKRFGAWCAGLFRKKDISDVPEIPENPESPEIPETPETPDNSDNSDNEIVIEINPTEIDEPDEPEEPEVPEIQDIPDETDELDTPETPDLDINETDEVELSEQLPPYDPRKDLEHYKFPRLDLLKVYDNETAPVIDQEEQQNNANRIVTTLRNYGIEIEQIKATVGPTVTLYEVVPKAGIRIAKIQNLENDIMMSLSATGIRIIAPMPGKGTVGIEVPNENPQTVSMHSVIASKRFQEEQKMKLPIAYGRTITNEVFMFDLAKTPHLLVAGATGTGKSVAINAIITSLLYKKHPAELKLVMVDPKMVEFAPYKPLLKHYLAAMPNTDPEQIVITDCDRVVNTLNSLVIEMENRYKLLMDAGVRNLEDYNAKFIARRLNPEKLVADSLHHRFLPYIVIIIDEYGDFIMQAGKQVETPIARITQKARAVGMHMILATQRPSVNIVTGVIKANIPTRIALRTQSVIDSRTVLDSKGAEQLIGRGDSLYAGNANITRVQCAFVDTPEVDEIVNHIAHQQCYFEPYQLPEYIPEGQEELAPGSVDTKRLDPMFADVARYVVSKQEGSTSRLQRVFEIGYNRAGKLSDQLEATGIVGPNKGPKGRDVLIQDMATLEQLLASLNA